MCYISSTRQRIQNIQWAAFILKNSHSTRATICPSFSWCVLFFLMEMVSRWNSSILDIFFENSRCLAAQLEEHHRHIGYIWAGQCIWFCAHMQAICIAQVQQAKFFLDVLLLGSPAEKESKPVNYSGWMHTFTYNKRTSEWRTQFQAIVWTIAILQSSHQMKLKLSSSAVLSPQPFWDVQEKMKCVVRDQKRWPV